MKSTCLFLLFSAMALTACKDPGETGLANAVSDIESVQFDTVFIEKEMGNCAREESNCLTISIQYPLLKGRDSLNEVINEKIKNWLTGSTTDSIKTVDELVQLYMNDYNKLKSSQKGRAPGWQIEKVIQVTYNQNHLFCLRLEEFENTGGAHPVSRTTFRNYYLTNFRKLQLKDLFVANYEDTLSSLAEFFYKQARALELDGNSNAVGFDFKTQKFTLNNNFVLDESGITFVFNSSEIASYSEGISEFTIPYADLVESNLIRHDGPLGYLVNPEMAGN